MCESLRQLAIAGRKLVIRVRELLERHRVIGGRKSLEDLSNSDQCGGDRRTVGGTEDSCHGRY